MYRYTASWRTPIPNWATIIKRMPIGTLPGQVLASGVTSPTVEDVRICFGEIEAVPIFAGLSSFVALYQIVVTVPNVPPGDVLVLAKVAGLQSQDGISINVAAP